MGSVLMCRLMRRLIPVLMAAAIGLGATGVREASALPDGMHPVFQNGVLVGFLFCERGRCIYHPF